MSKFESGPNPLRNKNGRPPSATGIATKVIKLIGPEVANLCSQALVMANAGDPAAIAACAYLLSAALQNKAG